MVWRKDIEAMFVQDAVGLLAKGWIALAVCGLVLAHFLLSKRSGSTNSAVAIGC